MHSNIRDQHLKIITYIQITIYKPHGNHKPKLYDRYMHTHKRYSMQIKMKRKLE